MTLIALMRVAALTAIVTTGATSGAIAQATVADPHHRTTLAQATPGQGQSQDAQPTQPSMMRPGMAGQGMMGQGMMSQGRMGQGMMGGRGHMMKVMFAIADTDGDGALSF